MKLKLYNVLFLTEAAPTVFEAILCLCFLLPFPFPISPSFMEERGKSGKRQITYCSSHRSDFNPMLA